MESPLESGMCVRSQNTGREGSQHFMLNATIFVFCDSIRHLSPSLTNTCKFQHDRAKRRELSTAADAVSNIRLCRVQYSFQHDLMTPKYATQILLTWDFFVQCRCISESVQELCEWIWTGMRYGNARIDSTNGLPFSIKRVRQINLKQYNQIELVLIIELYSTGNFTANDRILWNKFKFECHKLIQNVVFYDWSVLSSLRCVLITPSPDGWFHRKSPQWL